MNARQTIREILDCLTDITAEFDYCLDMIDFGRGDLNMCISRMVNVVEYWEKRGVLTHVEAGNILDVARRAIENYVRSYPAEDCAEFWNYLIGMFVDKICNILRCE